MKFLDPKNDFAFKKIFGDKHKKHILIHFLNSILQLPEHHQITEVNLVDPKQVPHLPGSKESVLDVRCHDEAGAEYIVEMQVLPEKCFDKRVLYYVSKTYAHQLGSGRNYNRLKPIIFLGILNFNFTEDPHYLSTHCIQNIDSKESIFKDFQFTLAELPKFTKTESELETVEDKWLYFLKHAKGLKSVPSVIHEAAVKEAFEIVNSLTWDEASLDAYDRSDIFQQQRIQQLDFSFSRGEEKGRAEGIAKGIAKGRAEGIAEGRAEGEATLITRQLKRRFGDIPEPLLQKIAQSSAETLLIWGDRVLDAKTIDEVFKD